MTALAPVLLLAACLPGQADRPSPQHKHLQGLESLIGDWEYSGEIPDEGGGEAGAKGLKAVMHLTARWIWNKGAVQLDFSTRAADEKEIEAVRSAMIVVWNPGLKKILCAGADLSGHTLQGVWNEDPQGKGWVITITGTHRMGDNLSLRMHFRIKDKDTLVVNATQVKVGDKTMPDTPEIPYTRKSAKP